MNDASTHTAPEVNLRLVILSKMDFLALNSWRSAALNTTAGSSCPLLFSLQHTLNFFSAPPPLLSCLTCSSFCVGAQWLDCAGWRLEEASSCPHYFQMCNQHLRNMPFSSSGLSVVTSFNKPIWYLSLPFMLYLLPSSNSYTHLSRLFSLVTTLAHLFYNKTLAVGREIPSCWLTEQKLLKQVKLMPVIAKFLSHSQSQVPTNSLLCMLIYICMYDRVAWGLQDWPSTC